MSTGAGLRHALHAQTKVEFARTRLEWALGRRYRRLGLVGPDGRKTWTNVL